MILVPVDGGVGFFSFLWWRKQPAALVAIQTL